jgi:signal transduction histidine kinase
MDDNLARALDRRCFLALSLVAVLVLANEVIVQPSLVRLTTDAPLINVAGRQRMLSQRLTKAALAIDRANPVAHAQYVEELRSVLEVWSASQERFSTGSNSRQVTAAFEELNPVFLRLRKAAASLVSEADKQVPNRKETRHQLNIILANEADYLVKMEKIVDFYESDSRKRVHELWMIGVALTGLILLSLLAIGRLILHPAVKLIRLQVDELRRSRVELEDRVKERTRQFEEAQERHLQLVEQLGHVGRTTTIGEMASGLAHELNQPLGAIANYAEGCLIALKSRLPAIDEIKAALERLLETTHRAGRIIAQVRKFVTRNGQNREIFEPNQTVNDVLEILAVEASRSGIKVVVEPALELPYLWGDVTQIQQVLINLVRNAFESLSHSQVENCTVVMRTGQTEQREVFYEVEDNGEGIKTTEISRVFDAYYSTRAEGMGMGLAICRSIVEAHHGQLEVKSVEGRRTVFRFTLPVTIGNENDAEFDGIRG